MQTFYKLLGYVKFKISYQIYKIYIQTLKSNIMVVALQIQSLLFFHDDYRDKKQCINPEKHVCMYLCCR